MWLVTTGRELDHLVGRWPCRLVLCDLEQVV